MCGIYFEGSHQDEESLRNKERSFHQNIKCRGPDGSHSAVIKIGSQHSGYFEGHVLWLQGSQPVLQPIIDKVGNMLLWNGDILSGIKVPDGKNDGVHLMELISDKSVEEISKVFESIEGPWSVIYYSIKLKTLLFGRDFLGRHSLLWTSPNTSTDTSFILSSVSTQYLRLTELPPLGIYYINFEKIPSANLLMSSNIRLIPWIHDLKLSNDFPRNIAIDNSSVANRSISQIRRDVPSKDLDKILSHVNLQLNQIESDIDNFSNARDYFIDIFMESVKRRIRACPLKCKNCSTLTREISGDSGLYKEVCGHSIFGVMFSGGVDCTFIAQILNLCLDPQESIDLLNVSFGVTTQSRSEVKTARPNRRGRIEPKIEDLNTGDVTYDSPDRLTANATLIELRKLNPNRKWNFIEINVTVEELQKERRDTISTLIHPQDSVIDDSIGCALYFCGRATGTCDGNLFSSSARVLFSGFGADEQLCGYMRHRSVFQKGGWDSIVSEVQMEMDRLHCRNLGRDNRVISHHGRALRLPFLDEKVISFLTDLPIWLKINPYLPRGLGEKILLRSAVASLGFDSAALLPKRAIQFGSRIAKLENRKEKGGETCSRLENLTLI